MQMLDAIDPHALAAVTGGLDWQQVGRAAVGGANAGYDAASAGPPYFGKSIAQAGAALAVGFGAAAADVGVQRKWW